MKKKLHWVINTFISYMKEKERKEAERFSELEQKESNELKIIKENVL